MYGYIYKTTNLINGKIYIGKKKSNKFLDNNYLGSGKIIRQAIEKYGKDNFSVELLEKCDSLDALNEKEKYYIEYYNSQNLTIGYNISFGGDGGITWGNDKHPFKDKHHTEESKRKNSEHCKGRVPWNKGKKGIKKMSEETKEKIRLKNLGKKKHRIKKHNVPMKEETKEKLRQLNLGKKIPIERVEKIRTTQLNKHLHWFNNGVVEIKASDCPIGYTLGRLKMSSEQKQKLSNSHRGKLPWNKGLSKENTPSLARPNNGKHLKNKRG